MKPMMTVEEFLEKVDFDIDVIDDYADDLWIAYCPPTALTEKGKEKFKDILGLGVSIIKNGNACVLVSDNKDCERLHEMLIEFFESIAGYCTEDEWEEWFYYPDEDYEDDVSEVGYNPYLGCIDDDC